MRRRHRVSEACSRRGPANGFYPRGRYGWRRDDGLDDRGRHRIRARPRANHHRCRSGKTRPGPYARPFNVGGADGGKNGYSQDTRSRLRFARFDLSSQSGDQTNRHVAIQEGRTTCPGRRSPSHRATTLRAQCSTRSSAAVYVMASLTAGQQGK